LTTTTLDQDDAVLAAQLVGPLRAEGPNPLLAAGGQVAARKEGDSSVRRCGLIRVRKF